MTYCRNCISIALAVFFGVVPVFSQSTTTDKQTVKPSIASVATVAPSATPAEERYRIGFQDTLEVQVFRHPELSKRVNVAPDGTISLFRLDRPITAVCKTVEELAAEIAAAYEKDYLRNPEVSVMAVDQKSQSVSVIGAVEKPGNFYINRRVHLLELIAFAGGPKTDEAGARLLVARTGSKSNCQNAGPANENSELVLMDFKLREVQQGKQTLWMQPGDVVSVLDADLVYVYGNVNKQGSVKMKEPLTLTQAIVLAEGLKPATKKDKIRVLRRKTGTSETEEMIFDLAKIDKGTATDPYLEPNDIVAVSEDKAKSIINSIARSLTGGASNIFYRIPGN